MKENVFRISFGLASGAVGVLLLTI
jgi:hypothetical protein